MRQCPRCRLLNPDSGTKCDCGFNLTTVAGQAGTDRIVDKVPFAIKVHFALCLFVAAYVVYRFATDSPLVRARALELLIWIVGGVFLYFHLMAHKNWARIALGIWTLPAGLLLFSRGAKRFTQGPDDKPPGELILEE